MKVLILGAKGSLGQTFTDLYQDQDVTAWDHDELDITQAAAVIEKITALKPDLIINCAAYNSVDKAEEERSKAKLINGTAVGFIAKAASKIGATVVQFSTAYVYSGDSVSGYEESDPPSPRSEYAESKLLGENELSKNLKQYYIVRTTWLYGKISFTGKQNFVQMMIQMAESHQDIDGIEDEFGNPTYAVDLAKATRELVEQKADFGIYHLVNEGTASWYDWAKEIFNVKHILKAKLNPISRDRFIRPAARPKYGILKNTKFLKLRPWQEALKEYLA